MKPLKEVLTWNPCIGIYVVTDEALYEVLWDLYFLFGEETVHLLSF
jgi:hypothetical protein